MYLPLPVAFRSLSRLSSALSAKASTLRSLSLNLRYISVCNSIFDVCLVFKQVFVFTNIFGLFLGCLYLLFFAKILIFCSVFNFQGSFGLKLFT